MHTISGRKITQTFAIGQAFITFFKRKRAVVKFYSPYI